MRTLLSIWLLCLTTCVAAQSPPARFISPLNCVYKGKVNDKNVVQTKNMLFKVSQKGHDAYNQFSISHDTTISGVKVGSFVFRSLPTSPDLDNGQYSKKLHFDIYDYANLNGNKDLELIKAGDQVYVTFLVKFVTRAPTPTTGSKFDNGNIKYRRNLYFQFWPGGVSTHFNSYPADSDEAQNGKFGYVTVLTGDYGKNKTMLSEKFQVEQDDWYRVYFEYNPHVENGAILAKIAPHELGMQVDQMTTILNVKGNTLYQDKSQRRMLPTFGSYHWGGNPTIVETQFTEIQVDSAPLKEFPLIGADINSRN